MGACRCLKRARIQLSILYIFGLVFCVWLIFQILTAFVFINYVDLVDPLRNAMGVMALHSFDFLIFQIGFNKCGTTSLFRFMKANGIPSIHNTPCTVTSIHSNLTSTFYLARVMVLNYQQNRSILPAACTDYFAFFSDFGHEIAGDYYMVKRTVLQRAPVLSNEFYTKYIHAWYPALQRQYANSKYLLNIRNVNTWLRSKYLHRPATFALTEMEHRFNTIKRKINAFIDENNSSKHLGIPHLTDVQILRMFRQDWYLYICNTRKYFEHNGISENLLIFNVETDDIEKLIEFFDKFGIQLETQYWKQKNKSNALKWTTNSDEQQRAQWDQIESEYPEFSTDYSNVTETEMDRINEQCKLLHID